MHSSFARVQSYTRGSVRTISSSSGVTGTRAARQDFFTHTYVGGPATVTKVSSPTSAPTSNPSDSAPVVTDLTVTNHNSRSGSPKATVIPGSSAALSSSSVTRGNGGLSNMTGLSNVGPTSTSGAQLPRPRPSHHPRGRIIGGNSVVTSSGVDPIPETNNNPILNPTPSTTAGNGVNVPTTEQPPRSNPLPINATNPSSEFPQLVSTSGINHMPPGNAVNSHVALPMSASGVRAGRLGTLPPKPGSASLNRSLTPLPVRVANNAMSLNMTVGKIGSQALPYALRRKSVPDAATSAIYSAFETSLPSAGNQISGSNLMEFHVTALQGKRPYMEDTASHRTMMSNYHMFGVFDGHGGKLASEYCASHMLDNISRHIENAATAAPKKATDALNSSTESEASEGFGNRPPSHGGSVVAGSWQRNSGSVRAPSPDRSAGAQTGPKDNAGPPSPNTMQEALRQGFLETERRFMELAGRNQWRDGTTALVCIVGDGVCHVAHAGDTRLACVKSGAAKSCCVALTDDHRPDRPAEEQRIKRDGGKIVRFGPVARLSPGNIAVSRSLGDYILKSNAICGRVLIPEPEVKTYPIEKDAKFLVMATDGVWDVINTQQCGELIRSCNTAAQASHILVHTAYNQGSMDNLTALVVKL